MEVLSAEEIVRLTPAERLALIAQLWDISIMSSFP
jgi:hypothetical protein